LSEQQFNADLGQEPTTGQAEAAAASVDSAEPVPVAGGAHDDRVESASPRQPESPQLRIPNRSEPGASLAPDPRITDLEMQLAEYKQQLQRMAADFDNFRRRAAAEKDELVSFAASRVLENFLPIVDNFERALAHMAKADPATLQQGVELIYKQAVDFLGRQGVAAMDPVGKLFDPNLHEAIGLVETAEHPDSSVLNEAQKGYFLNGRVLRHAIVQISSNPAERAAAEAALAAAAAAAAAGPAAETHDPHDSNHNNEDQAGSSEPAPDFTLEDLMAEAQAPEANKEESHG
jgi:molecular chaperone GrpE